MSKKTKNVFFHIFQVISNYSLIFIQYAFIQNLLLPKKNSVGAKFRQNKLDRAFFNEWLEKWPGARTDFFRGVTSGHAAMIIRFTFLAHGSKTHSS